jgi:anti-sigma regulatory factor (Ser/Thr protein kinase)
VTQELSFRLTQETAAVAEARHLLREVLAVWGLDETLTATVTLLASELVTNAIVHATPPIDLTLDWDDPLLRVEVSDGDDQLPVMVEPPRPAGDGGYGVLLIEHFSHGWGAAPRVGGGKVVWFEMNRDRQQN